MTELQEIAMEYHNQSLADYKGMLINSLRITPRLAVIENEHLESQLRHATPKQEQFWVNRISALLEVTQKYFPELHNEILGV